nr:sulfotransferase [Kordiimonas marina]
MFFCTCAQRSGSTLLTRILDSHSRIAAPFEIPMAGYYLNTSDQNVGLDKIIKISKLIGVPPTLALDDPKRFFAAILAHEGKETLVVKEPTNTRHLPRIFMDFGDVPLIHIVRDVRQVGQSEALIRAYGSAKRAMMLWLQYNLDAVKYHSYFSRAYLMHYEALTARPEQTIKDLVTYMGHEFEPAMLDYWLHDHSDDKLTLWDGMKPSETEWARDLYQGKIAAKVREPSAEVLEIYETTPQMRSVNERFGYR